MPLYKITFTDNSIFLGGDTLENNKWLQIPDKDILCLEFYLCDGSSLKLERYQSYAINIEVLTQLTKKLGNCPECNEPGKLTQAIIKHGNGRISKKYMARCGKCTWTGDIIDLKNKNIKSGKWIYLLGLKNGIVKSYRITLNGINGEDKYHTGDITTRDFPKGKEFKGKQPVADYAWKRGIIKKEVT